MTEQKPFPPVFATNVPGTGETVASEVNRMLAGLRTQLAFPPNLALATAYINPQGFALIADEVEQAPRVRILLGAEPDEPIQRRLDSGEISSFDDVSADYVMMTSSDDVDMTFIRWNVLFRIFVCGAVPAENIEL